VEFEMSAATPRREPVDPGRDDDVVFASAVGFEDSLFDGFGVERSDAGCSRRQREGEPECNCAARPHARHTVSVK